MEKILAIACSQAQLEILKKITGDMKIRLQEVSEKNTDHMLEEILQGNSTEENAGEEADGKNSLVIFCDLTEKHLDHVLARLREKKAGLCYKAVLTPTNRKWNLQKLYINMEMEKKQFEQMRAEEK